MSRIRDFDPAKSCSAGVCNPEVDLSLVAIAANPEWLRAGGDAT